MGACVHIEFYVGQQLRKRRLELGWSEQQLADHLGVAKDVIVSFESGEQRIDALTMYELTKLLSVDVHWFYATVPGADLLQDETRFLERFEQLDLSNHDAFNALMEEFEGDLQTKGKKLH